MPITLTGSTGFLGSAIVREAALRNLELTALPRAYWGLDDGHAEPCTPRRGLDPAVLAGCTALIHAGARAHVLRETATDPLATFRQANTTATVALAEAAIAAGVRRFVFVSSISALGNHSHGRPLSPLDPPAPVEPQAVSKAEAEQALVELAGRSGMEVIIIRPPLVHGAGAKGNFRRLMDGIWAGKPLPLGAVHNRRSFVGVGNLVDALLTAAEANRPGRLKPTLPYHLADDGVISTRRLVEVLAEGMGVKPRLISVPRWLAVGGATILGKGPMARRLFDDLEVDDTDFRRDFGWKPSLGLEEGLLKMGEAFAREKREGPALPNRSI
jgi:nucleoside-diphosphate-sugar epimerase